MSRAIKADAVKGYHTNRLICGDNLEVLTTLSAESVDLIYLDPPFFSNRNYEIIWGDEAEIRSFVDRWEGGIEVYLDWMRERIQEMYRVLKPTGSLYLHCDWHASHYLKVMLDEIFGYKNFKNEIVWNYQTGGASKAHYSRKHDVILFYAKGKDYKFYPERIKEERSEKSLLRAKNPKGARISITNTDKLPTDVWRIPALNPMDKERLGYPTQKPEALLEKIISASSDEGDIVLDPFCGCGTALAVAQKLKRKWIGMDISPSAIALVKNRFAKPEFINPVKYTLIGMPQKDEDVKMFDPFEFQFWVVNEMYGTPSNKKVGDMGIDGLTFMRHQPIQVKQSEKVGREVIDSFETAIRRYYGKNTSNQRGGIIVAFSFTKGAYEEVARVKRMEGIHIELLTVAELLDRKTSIPQSVRYPSHSATLPLFA